MPALTQLPLTVLPGVSTRGYRSQLVELHNLQPQDLLERASFKTNTSDRPAGRLYTRLRETNRLQLHSTIIPLRPYWGATASTQLLLTVLPGVSTRGYRKSTCRTSQPPTSSRACKLQPDRFCWVTLHAATRSQSAELHCPKASTPRRLS